MGPGEHADIYFVLQSQKRTDFELGTRQRFFKSKAVAAGD
jgi:CTP synthase (UTP-ammonia lyase)